MTNLTEQKGKKTHYYIKLPNSDVFIGDEFALSLYRNCKDGDKVEVLGEVPSYGEYENIITENTSLKQIRDELDCAITQLREDKIDLKEENTKLKELLKECEHIMCIEKDFASCHFEKDKLCKLLTKISQVLGEE